MKAILHIGLPKTGTSSIQSFCCRYYDYLQENKILYPKTGMQGQAHHLFARAVCMPEKKMTMNWIREADVKRLIEDLVEEVSNSSPDTVLLSSEAYGDVSILSELVNKLKETNLFHNFSVVVYLRRQDEYLEAKYSTDRRAALTSVAPEEYFKQHNGDVEYLWLLDQLEAIFGLQNVKVGIFEKTSGGKNLLEEFFEDKINIPIKTDFDTNITVNTRLTRDALTFLEKIREMEYFDQISNELIHILEDWSSNQVERFKYFSSYDLRKSVLDSQAENNATIAKKFLGRENGVLFQNSDISPEWEEYKGLTKEKFQSIIKYLNEKYFT
ncbi:hypothetical protein [Glaciecola sp. 1036]|uniref:hypothetical protein n=1 Tax=Alteromonadaceae TaxID=72275 RepID=UPI003D079755